MVEFDDALRELVRKTAEAVRACLVSGDTPHAEYKPRRCDACSLIDFCQPLAMRFKRGAAAWFRTQLATHQTAFTGESSP